MYNVQLFFKVAYSFDLTNVNFKVIHKLINLNNISSALILKSTTLRAPHSSVPPVYSVYFTGEVMTKENTMEIYKYYNDSIIHNFFK